MDDVERLAALDEVGVHSLVDDPVDADVVLFVQCHTVDWRLKAIREHPVARHYWRSVMVYDERDRPWRSFPGVYVSAAASSFDAATQRAACYLRLPHREPVDDSVEPDLLFSFVGSPSAACRAPLFRLRHPNAVVERIDNFMFWDSDAPGHAERRKHYDEILARSRFVLCPRGRGTSSFRLYEALARGRVPVIVSDDWVPPPGPDWTAFSIRVPEAAAGTISEVLEERDGSWPEMSAAAAAAYKCYFDEHVRFHRTADLLRELHEGGASAMAPWKMVSYAAIRSADESRKRLPRRLHASVASYKRT